MILFFDKYENEMKMKTHLPVRSDDENPRIDR